MGQGSAVWGGGCCTLTVQHGMRARGGFLLQAGPQFATLSSAISSGFGPELG